jgi:hypothetical protein
VKLFSISGREKTKRWNRLVLPAPPLGSLVILPEGVGWVRWVR